MHRRAALLSCAAAAAAAQATGPVPVVTAACASPVIKTQQFVANADGTVTSTVDGSCITSVAGVQLDPLVLRPCGSNGTQHFARGADGSVAVSPADGLCWNGDGARG